ncbi:MAG: S-layer family protein [Xenococcaceae cyanobacterium MO_207.B15]|nr:S-layer family protein [Xenococcaceae cyanobacterium MO_207.B15]
MLQGGSKIDASTDSVADGGSINIKAGELIELQGSDQELFSMIYAQVNQNGSGNGGDIIIESPQLKVSGGSQISAATLGNGEGGTISITSESIELSDYIPYRGELPRFITPIIDTPAAKIRSGIYASSPGVGNANALNVDTGSITLNNGAQISVSSQKQGAAGNLSINADRIRLNNSILSAETVAGEQANILLTVPDIQLRNNSLITTNALQTATGGNINIDAETLVSLENSDITANAQDNFGGQVTISAQGVFGTQIREFPTPQSDITATSRLGTEYSGVVEINTPDADPATGALTLPENFINASEQIVSSCALDRNNSFVVTGRGGLPPTPQEFFRGQTVLQDWRTSINSEQLAGNSDRSSVSNKPSEIVEAQQWIVNSKGVVELVAANSQVNSSSILPITNHQSPIPPGGDLIDPGIETKTDRLMLEVSFRPCHHYVIYSAHLLKRRGND